MKSLSMLVTLLLAASSGSALPDAAERTVVPLTDPAKPMRLKVHTIRGGITVKGYDGKDVVVEVRARSGADDEGGAGEGRYPGMKRVPARSPGLTVEEQSNVVSVNTDSARSAADLVIQVPMRASLELGCVNDGAIVVDNIQGDVEAQNVNGAITLSGISGSALANTTNGGVTASFVRLDPGKAMSFVTLNGTVDVTLPAGTKANLNMGIVQQGDIYTDFEVVTKGTLVTAEAGKREKDGKYVLRIDHAVRGAINGGGPEFTLKTFNGDIVVRESK
jgi:hypothetical protein